MITNEHTKLVFRQVSGGIKAAINDHPEFGLQPHHIGSVAKRIACSISGEMIEQIRTGLREEITKEYLYQELEKENKRLLEKCESLAKSNKHLSDKLEKSYSKKYLDIF